MDALNYHHLQYFWMTVREGSIAAASRRLQVGAPAISMQIKALEAALGRQLLERQGRRLAPTRAGELAFEHAETIFRAGEELVRALRSDRAALPRLRVGVADVLSKSLAFQILSPLLETPEDDDPDAPPPPSLDCQEAPPDDLFADLALRRLDLVLSDAPPRSAPGLRVHPHSLGSIRTVLLGAPSIVERLEGPFPACLQGAPLLLPPRSSALRRGLDAWLDEQGLRPIVRGEFADSALLKTFGQAGVGLFPAPTVARAELERQYDVASIGEVPGLREEVFLVTPDRVPRDERIRALLDHARHLLGRAESGRPGLHERR